MNAGRMSLRATAAVALRQVALAAVVTLLLAGWLHIPDANVAEVLASVLLAVLIAAIACAGEAAIALRLVNKPAAGRRLLLGAATVFAAALLWYLVSLGVDHLSANNELRAGYLNSRFPASLRNLFSYEHLLRWFGWAESALRCIAGGLLAAAAFVLVTGTPIARGVLAILRSGRYWLSLVLLTMVAAVVTGVLLSWAPGHGLQAEVVGLVLRVLTAVALNALAIALLLQAMANAVFRDQSGGSGAPDSSKPRTADMP